MKYTRCVSVPVLTKFTEWLSALDLASGFLLLLLPALIHVVCSSPEPCPYFDVALDYVSVFPAVLNKASNTCTCVRTCIMTVYRVAMNG